MEKMIYGVFIERSGRMWTEKVSWAKFIRGGIHFNSESEESCEHTFEPSEFESDEDIETLLEGGVVEITDYDSYHSTYTFTTDKERLEELIARLKEGYETSLKEINKLGLDI